MTDTPEQEAAKALISQGAAAYLEHLNPDQDGLYVTGWVLAAEWTSIKVERAGRGGITTVQPQGQSPSMSRGLAEFGAENYSLFNDDGDGDDD